MNLRGRNKVKAEFSMASLTDMIFLLLIFFMLNSTLVSPNALKLLLPKSDSKTIASQSVAVSITKDLQYYFDTKLVTLEQLPALIQGAVKGNEDATIVLNAEKSVPIENVVQVMNIANKLNVKMILATEPK